MENKNENKEIKDALFDKRQFTLDDVSYKKFIDALAAPTHNNKKLYDLLNSKPLWEH